MTKHGEELARLTVEGSFHQTNRPSIPPSKDLAKKCQLKWSREGDNRQADTCEVMQAINGCAVIPMDPILRLFRI